MRYVTKGMNVRHYEEGLTNVGRYETQGQNVGRYIQAAPRDWLANPIGVAKMPTPDGWTPDWPVRHAVGPSANYRVLPQIGGCGVCGMGVDSEQTRAPAAEGLPPPPPPPPLSPPPPAGNLLGFGLVIGAAVAIFWYFGREEVRRNPRRRRRARRNLVQGVASYSNAADAEAAAARKRRAGFRVDVEQWSPTKWIVTSHSK